MHKLWPAFLGAVLLLPLSALSQNPPKLATQARIDLFAGTTVQALTQARLLTGDGIIDRQGWRPEHEQPRTYSVHLPIVRYGWTEFIIEFLPQESGAVHLSLMGPWEEVSPGQIYLQEVFWDALEAEGTTLPNGSFESVSGNVIGGWSGGISQTASDGVPAVDGVRYVRTWHNNTLSRNITVTGGVTVRLRCFARAVLPANFKEMKRIASRDTPAHETASRFARGINFGNYLESRLGTWDISYSADDFVRARAEGFDHVRLPVAWHLYTGPGPEFQLAAQIFSLVDAMVAEAGKNNLGLLINWHHFDEFTSAPLAALDKFQTVWRQIATHYASAPHSVVFELLNEPRDAASTTVMNPIHEQTIRIIRETNPDRTIFIGTGKYNSIDDLNLLLLPDEDENLIATVHIYDPFLFTHQGATWAGPELLTRGIIYPGPPAVPLTPHPQASASWVRAWIELYNTEPAETNPSSTLAFQGKLRRAAQWTGYFGRPVYVGEFGCFETADPVSRVRFYREMREVMDAEGLGWAMWVWKAGFHYLRNGQPHPPGMREAIFPPLHLQLQPDGTLGVEAAIGKTLALQKTTSLNPPVQWQTLSIETLRVPSYRKTMPTTGSEVSFYRLIWLK
jgi:endoglucanase